jgi:signal transduction histidine kinase
MKNILLGNRLFIKISLWFWLAGLIIGLVFFLAPIIAQSDYLGGGWQSTTNTALVIYGQTAADLYEREGSEALQKYLQRIETESEIKGFLLNSEKKEVSNREPQSDFQPLLRGDLQKNETQFEAKNLNVLAAVKITTQSNEYIFLGEIPRTVSYSIFAVPPPVRFLRITLLIFTSLLVCFWLARHLTAPIVKLNDAAKRISKGDLTARIGAIFGGRNDELTDLSRNFDQMAEQLEALKNAQSRLFGDISHELRSPLARLNVATALARGGDKIEIDDALNVIEAEAATINEMIGQLLTIAKLESPDQNLQLNEIDVNELLREIVADAKFETINKTKTLEIRSLEQHSIPGDRKLLRSAIENAVRNALHYTAENTTVEIDAYHENKKFVIKIRDHGSGVPENALKDLFQPFYRVENARERSSGGTGLGLAIADRAAKLHGGTIKALNAKDGGLIIIISLP